MPVFFGTPFYFLFLEAEGDFLWLPKEKKNYTEKLWQAKKEEIIHRKGKMKVRK